VDSSALLKRYIDEPDSEAAEARAGQRVGGPAVPFLTFDLRQAQAARSLGLTVVGA